MEFWLNQYVARQDLHNRTSLYEGNLAGALARLFHNNMFRGYQKALIIHSWFGQFFSRFWKTCGKLGVNLGRKIQQRQDFGLNFG